MNITKTTKTLVVITMLLGLIIPGQAEAATASVVSIHEYGKAPMLDRGSLPLTADNFRSAFAIPANVQAVRNRHAVLGMSERTEQFLAISKDPAKFAASVRRIRINPETIYTGYGESEGKILNGPIVKLRPPAGSDGWVIGFEVVYPDGFVEIIVSLCGNWAVPYGQVSREVQTRLVEKCREQIAINVTLNVNVGVKVEIVAPEVPVRTPASAAANPPVCGTITASPRKYKLGEPVTFSMVGAHDPQGGQPSFYWNFGDGSAPAHSGVNPQITHRYYRKGNYDGSVVIDNGLRTSCPFTISAKGSYTPLYIGAAVLGAGGIALAAGGGGGDDDHHPGPTPTPPPCPTKLTASQLKSVYKEYGVGGSAGTLSVGYEGSVIGISQNCVAFHHTVYYARPGTPQNGQLVGQSLNANWRGDVAKGDATEEDFCAQIPGIEASKVCIAVGPNTVGSTTPNSLRNDSSSDSKAEAAVEPEIRSNLAWRGDLLSIPLTSERSSTQVTLVGGLGVFTNPVTIQPVLGLGFSQTLATVGSTTLSLTARGDYWPVGQRLDVRGGGAVTLTLPPSSVLGSLTLEGSYQRANAGGTYDHRYTYGVADSGRAEDAFYGSISAGIPLSDTGGLWSTMHVGMSFISSHGQSAAIATVAFGR